MNAAYRQTQDAHSLWQVWRLKGVLRPPLLPLMRNARYGLKTAKHWYVHIKFTSSSILPWFSLFQEFGQQNGQLNKAGKVISLIKWRATPHHPPRSYCGVRKGCRLSWANQGNSSMVLVADDCPFKLGIRDISMYVTLSHSSKMWHSVTKECFEGMLWLWDSSL